MESLCKDVMTKNPVVCEKSTSAAECAALMERENVGIIPVVDAKDKVVGVVTDRDLALRVLGKDKDGDTAVGEIMTKTLVSCAAKEKLHVAEDLMAKNKKSRILVLDDEGRCAGIISLADLGRLEERGRAGQVLGSVSKREARV